MNFHFRPQKEYHVVCKVVLPYGIPCASGADPPLYCSCNYQIGIVIVCVLVSGILFFVIVVLFVCFHGSYLHLASFCLNTLASLATSRTCLVLFIVTSFMTTPVFLCFSLLVAYHSCVCPHFCYICCTLFTCLKKDY